MLDTSDRDVFNSGNDPAMGTSVFSVDVGSSQPAIVLIFDKNRRSFIIKNSGPETVYFSLTTEVSPELYSFSLRPGRFLSMDHYGGVVVAICDLNQTAKLYITDVH